MEVAGQDEDRGLGILVKNGADPIGHSMVAVRRRSRVEKERLHILPLPVKGSEP